MLSMTCLRQVSKEMSLRQHSEQCLASLIEQEWLLKRKLAELSSMLSDLLVQALYLLVETNK